jgi:hypothetical protein
MAYKHRKDYLNYQKKYYRKHKIEHTKYAKKYQKLHKMQHSKSCKKYIQLHPEERKKSCLKYRSKNKDKINQVSRLQENINKKKNIELIKKYGITLKQLQQMIIAQNNKCAICHSLFKNNKDTQVDHDHDKNIIRQLLCSKCNVGLGYFDENIERMKNAIEYITKWRVPCL